MIIRRLDIFIHVNTSEYKSLIFITTLIVKIWYFRENGLSLSALKTHSVMFTWRRNWRDQLTKPLQVDNTEIEIRNTTKFLGVTLDSKLSWNEHIEQKCKKAKSILMLCRRAIGPCWGFTPMTMRWIYTAVVRPTITYAAMTWINGLYKQHNLAKLKSVQRLANILITGALPSSPGDPLNMITNMMPWWGSTWSTQTQIQ